MDQGVPNPLTVKAVAPATELPFMMLGINDKTFELLNHLFAVSGIV